MQCASLLMWSRAYSGKDDVDSFFLDSAPRGARTMVVLGGPRPRYTVRRVFFSPRCHSLAFRGSCDRSRSGWARAELAIVFVYLALFAALGGAGVAVGPRLSTEAQSLAQKLPDMTTRIQTGAVFGGLLQRHGWESREILELERLVQTHMGGIIGYAQQAAAALLTWLAGARG